MMLLFQKCVVCTELDIYAFIDKVEQIFFFFTDIAKQRRPLNTSTSSDTKTLTSFIIQLLELRRGDADTN